MYDFSPGKTSDTCAHVNGVHGSLTLILASVALHNYNCITILELYYNNDTCCYTATYRYKGKCFIFI